RAGHLHAMALGDARVGLPGDLDLQPGHPGVDAAELGQLVLSASPDARGDANPPALEDEIHPSPFVAPPVVRSRGRGPSLADLVFGPTLACRGDRRLIQAA